MFSSVRTGDLHSSHEVGSTSKRKTLGRYNENRPLRVKKERKIVQETIDTATAWGFKKGKKWVGECDELLYSR